MAWVNILLFDSLKIFFLIWYNKIKSILINFYKEKCI